MGAALGSLHTFRRVLCIKAKINYHILRLVYAVDKASQQI